MNNRRLPIVLRTILAFGILTLPAAARDVSSNDSFITEGFPGGSFSPAAMDYMLTNNGEDPLEWTAEDDADWLEVAPAAGTLEAGETVTVTASTNATADTKGIGTYPGSISFTNSETGTVTQVSAELRVSTSVSVPFSEDFEGSLGFPWTVTGTGTFRTAITTEHEPFAGSQQLLMDSSATQSAARNELTLTADLAGETNIKISFYAKEISDESHPSPPSPYLGGADFDGVSVSADGTNWYTVFEFPAGFSEFTRFVIDLDDEVANHGLTYNNEFRIRFNQFDNSPAPMDGIVIDEISIGAAAIPGVASLPFRDGFEKSLADHWNITGTGPFRAEVTGNHGPQEGSQHFVMDSTQSQVDALNELTLTIDLEREENIEIVFWAKDFTDERHHAPGAPFANHANFDGVAVSIEGALWYPIFTFPNSMAEWTEIRIDLDAAVAEAGISYSNRFLIRFNQFDNGSVDADGIALDDIRVFSNFTPELNIVQPNGLPLLSDSRPLVFEETRTGFSSTLDLTIHNNGVADLSDYDFTVEGANPNDFTVWQVPIPLAPNDDGLLILQFIPSGLGLRTATINLTTNDPGTSPFVIHVEGNGISAAVNSLTLPELAEQPTQSNNAFRAQARTVQYAFGESLLGDLPVGSAITGMSFRLNGGSSSWPASNVTFDNFDVQISASNNNPGSLNDFFGENIGDDLVTARSGPLTIFEDSFPSGSAPNPLGPQISFTTPFTYHGGPLLVTIRHTGNGLSHALLDAVPDMPGIVQGLWSHSASAYTATTKSSGGSAPVTNFSFNPPPTHIYSRWTDTTFTPAQLLDPSISGPNADPDQDRVVNLFEYVFDLDAFDTNDLPWQHSIETQGADQFLMLSFSIPADFAEDGTLIVEESQSLGQSDPWLPLATKEGTLSWQSDNGGLISQSPVVNGRINLTVRSSNAISDPNANGFLRIRAEIPGE